MFSKPNMSTSGVFHHINAFFANRMRRCGLPCPQALALKKHVLVMSFIGGDDGRPAPQLKTVKLSRDAAMNAFEQCRKVRVHHFKFKTILNIFSDHQKVYIFS
jgi:hypothetical protein